MMVNGEARGGRGNGIQQQQGISHRFHRSTKRGSVDSSEASRRSPLPHPLQTPAYSLLPTSPSPKPMVSAKLESRWQIAPGIGGEYRDRWLLAPVLLRCYSPSLPETG